MKHVRRSIVAVCVVLVAWAGTLPPGPAGAEDETTTTTTTPEPDATTTTTTVPTDTDGPAEPTTEAIDTPAEPTAPTETTVEPEPDPVDPEPGTTTEPTARAFADVGIAADTLDAASLSVGITTSSATRPTGALVDYVVNYGVTGGDLADAFVEVTLPADRFRTVGLVTTGGQSSSVSTPGPIVVRYELGTVTSGTTGQVALSVRTLQLVLPDGTTVAPTATFGGTGAAPVTSNPAPTVTLRATSSPHLSKAPVGYVPAAHGPLGEALQPGGFELGYDLWVWNPCGANNTFALNEGCLAFRGVLHEELPAGSFLVQATQVRPTDTDEADPALPAGVPHAFDTSALVSGTTGTVTIPTFTHVATACGDGSGAIAQFSYPVDGVGACGAWATQPLGARLRVVVWVPSPDPGPDTYVNRARLSGTAADNGTDVTAGPVDAQLRVVSQPTQELVKQPIAFGSPPFQPIDAAWALACGDTPYDPSVPVGNGACVIPYHGIGRFTSVLTTDGPLIDVRVTDRLPAEVVWVADYVTPDGWTTTYSTDPGCDQTSPDGAFGASPGPDVRCVRWSNPLVSGASTFFGVAVRRADDVDLAPGGVLHVVNQTWSEAPNATNPEVTDTGPHTIVNQTRTRSFKSATPSTVTGGQSFTYEYTALADPEFSDFGPRDWTLTDPLPADFSFTGFEVVAAPRALGGSTLPVTCTAPTDPVAMVRCVAAGDAAHDDGAGGENRFVVRITIAVRVGAIPGVRQNVRLCSWSDTDAAPLDGNGHPIAYRETSPEDALAFGACSNPDVHGPVAVTGVSVLNTTKTLESPSGGVVEPGQDLRYRIDYRHLPASSSDSTGAYVYDFPGRNPVDGSVIGTGSMTFVSATAPAPTVLEYTCDPVPATPIAAAATLTWGDEPCTGVTGVRWLLDYHPDAAPGTYRVTDPPGAVVVTLRAPAELADGTVLANQSGIVSEQVLPAGSPAANVTVRRHVDLAVTKRVDVARPQVGDTVTFTLGVTNQGPNPATGVVLGDLVPAGLTVTGSDPSQGTYDPVTGAWAVGDLALGASATLDIQATVDVGEPITNVVAVTALDQLDPDPTNDRAEAGVDPLVADVAVTKSVDDATPRVGDAVVYTVTVTNRGPDDAHAVEVTDTYPAGIAVELVAPDTGTIVAATGVWTVGDLAVDQVATLTIVGRVLAPGRAVNVVQVTGARELDPEPSNNVAEAPLEATASTTPPTTPITPTTPPSTPPPTTTPPSTTPPTVPTTPVPETADVAITKVAPSPVVPVGQVFDYTLTVVNGGATPATGVVVVDEVPDRFTVLAVGGPCTATVRLVTCSLGDLAPGATVVVTITVRAERVGDTLNTARVTTVSPDADPTDDESSFRVQIVDRPLALTGGAVLLAAGSGATLLGAGVVLLLAATRRRRTRSLDRAR